MIMIPTADELEPLTMPFTGEQLTLTYGGMILTRTRVYTYNTHNGDHEMYSGYSNRQKTFIDCSAGYIHIYIPCTDRIRADVLLGMIRHDVMNEQRDAG